MSIHFICQNLLSFMIICENLLLFMIICENHFLFMMENLFACTYFYFWESFCIHDYFLENEIMNTTNYHRDNITVRTLKTQIESNLYFKEIHSQTRWLDISSAISTKLVRPPLATYSSQCSTCVTYGMPCHSRGHWHVQPNPVTTSAMDLRERFFTLECFLPCTPSCSFQSFLGSPQFNFKVSRASCWSSKHSPGLTICLNHSNPQKVYTGMFYLTARAGQPRNINLTKH